MLTKRIIPCLDVKEGRTVKGTRFVDLHDAGDPVELAARYSDEGADELVLLDIGASKEGRKTFLRVVRDVAHAVRIPFTVGGGISSTEDIVRVLDAGADKVSLNTGIVSRPDLLEEASSKVGGAVDCCGNRCKEKRRELEGIREGGGRSRPDSMRSGGRRSA